MRAIKGKIITKEIKKEEIGKRGSLYIPQALEKISYKNVEVIVSTIDKVKEGDTLCIPKHSGIEFNHNGEDYLRIGAGDILYIE